MGLRDVILSSNNKHTKKNCMRKIVRYTETKIINIYILFSKRVYEKVYLIFNGQ